MRKNALLGYLYAMPWLIGMCVFLVLPICASLYLSLTEYDLMSPPWFVGLQNFRDLFHDNVFWISLGNTAFYFGFGLPAQLIFALLLALHGLPANSKQCASATAG